LRNPPKRTGRTIGSVETTDRLTLALAIARATIESTTDGILVTDAEGRITDFNLRYAEMFGLAPASIRDGDHRDVLRSLRDQVSDPAAHQAGVERIYREAPDETRDMIDLAGGRLIERFTRQLVVDGHVLGRVWSFRDVTEHRQAERDHAHLAAIVTSSHDAIISKTLDGVITTWNAAAERMFGYSADEAIGRPITMIIPPERIHEEQEFLRRLRLGERVENYGTVRIRKDGQPILVSLTISPIRDEEGRIIGASKTARDVTERERLLTAEQEARARAEEASRLKDDFLATVSHELRTPLNAILGWVQLLRTKTLDPERSEHAIEVIERNALAQAQVIEDILDVSRIITGKLRLKVQSLMPIAPIEAAIESMRPAAVAKDVRLLSVLDPAAGPVTGDPARLQQVAWNLLSNAIKFTPKGGRVEVRLELVESHIEIVVSDTGEGISPEFLPHVFDRFRQADASTTRAVTGLGLGLAIVRHLVELHGGTVVAESLGKGRGSTFTVLLPLRPLRGPGESEERMQARIERRAARLAAHAPELNNVRILIVDDEADTRELLREVLIGCGADVCDAASGEEALRYVEEWKPQVIVSDIGMPVMDGYDFIRHVRERGHRMPAVALTAYARSEDRVRALMAGYQVHVAKPIEPMEFALVVAGVLSPA
jgi:PAS domain S-box-containing protein